jgi:hypothetical protein
MTTTHVETPKRAFDWYLKWVSTFLVLASVAFRAAGAEYREFDLVLGFTASVGWLVVSIIWKDRALILLNGVMACILASSIIPLVF